jgi:geranylgeranyl pyrophosphate synthase
VSAGGLGPKANAGAGADRARGASAGGDAVEWVQSQLEAALELCLAPSAAGASPGVPARLEEALRYALLGPGKRLRPILVKQTCEALGGDTVAARWPAAAIECLHTYSLVHDDLPAMDDDDLRRGRPTCHVVYGEALAILVGDALQTLAFELLAQAGARASEMVLELARASGALGMVGGQVLDLFPGDRESGLAGVRRMHQLKTGRLFEAALVLGALAADPGRRAPAATIEHARLYGRALGRLFQAVDDVLDVTGSASDLGKTPGKDKQRGRDNLVELLGLDGARAEAAAAAQDAETWARRLFGGGPGPLLELPANLLARSR